MKLTPVVQTICLLMLMAGVSFAVEQPPNAVLIFADDLGCYGATKVQTPNIDSLAKEGRRFNEKSNLEKASRGKARVTGSDAKKALEASPSKPNFVVIFADDQGYSDVGCFGSPDIRTPRLDAMAANGIKFTDFYAQPVCGPSRAALMTGCYPMRVAERGNTKQVHPILHSDEITIAEILKTQGYATACFGKWDLAKHAQQGFFMDLMPTRQGFDYFYGTPTSNDRIANLYRNEELIEPNANMATLTQQYTNEAIGFMRKHKERPFFVYIPHTMPHTRLDASPQFKGKSKRGLYGDVIEEIDFNVGRILDAVKELDLSDNTYVIFTSDNGPWLIKNKNFADGRLPGDHGGSAGSLRSGKVSTFEGGVRVPFIIQGPNVPAGKECRSIASTLDIFPTFAALAGAAVTSDRVIDGEDIRHLIHGEFDKANTDKAFYYYLRVHLQAVRQGKWKLHLPREKEPIGAAPFSNNRHIAPGDRIGFVKPFLVNLESDLGETTDVSEQHPEVVDRLLGLAESMRDDLGDYDRVGTNMRFFDLTGPRPSKPPVPAVRKKKAPNKKDAPKKKATSDKTTTQPNTQSKTEDWFARVPRGVTIKRDLAFLATGRKEKLDLYQPAPHTAEDRRPAVIIIHGGGWAKGDKGREREFISGTMLAKAGYIAVSVNYETRVGKRWPNNLHDCKNAVRWLRQNATELGVDPDRIGVIGGSAGGHLALMVAYTGDHPKLSPAGPYPGISDKVSACVDMYGITNLLTRRVTSKDGTPTDELKEHRLFKQDREEAPAKWREAAPVNYVDENSPPTLILHGTKDTVVDRDQSKELYQVLQNSGVESNLILIEGAGHAWPLKTEKFDLRPEVVEFFDRHLKR